ncbi:protein kinase-like domain, Phloem protein 2-like protein [Artemisia annua]|uniref:Protein kinase-like domain, Phloem protein 2-like protein n=1 Tax=Artemisia annua TaxID=35608 RepID=A0A2U1K9J9_ARTAN|nr:protein kinase-like domain, Phloem protein 2-like protein [Artemisia annua]
MVAYECLDDDSDDRPSALDVMEQLEKALELQEDYEIWAAKLPKDYKEIFGMSKSPEMYSTKSNKDLYDMLNKGILLQQDKVLFSLGSSGERNEMISARKFSYKKRWLHRWRSVPESRFPKVAEVLDVRNLMIEIKLKTPLLSLGVNYKVNLIFRFCGPRKSYAKRMYVNLKYKKGGENFHAYFATWRDDGWMIIELCPFFYNKEDTDFEVISDEVGKVEEVQANDNVMKQGDIENIEVQSIDNVKQVEIGKLMKFQQFLKSDSKRDKLKYMLSKMNRKKHDMLSDVKDHIIRKVNEKKDHLVSKVSTKKDRLLSRVNRKKDRFVSRVNRVKDHLVSAKDVLYGYFDEELNLTPSAQSRFETGNDEMLKISDNHDECEELLSVSNVNRNEHHMLSAKDFLYGTSKVTLLQLKPSVQSRFQEVVELRSQQVLHIKYKIKFQMSPNTEYACYLKPRLL